MLQPESVPLPPSVPPDPKGVASHTADLLAHDLMDMDLAERIVRALRATGYPPLRAVEVAVRDRRVVLRGRVPSFYMKQIAQAAVLAVPGACALCNALDVDDAR
jgi:hypothetical protein